MAGDLISICMSIRMCSRSMEGYSGEVLIRGSGPCARNITHTTEYTENTREEKGNKKKKINLSKMSRYSNIIKICPRTFNHFSCHVNTRYKPETLTKTPEEKDYRPVISVKFRPLSGFVVTTPGGACRALTPGTIGG